METKTTMPQFNNQLFPRRCHRVPESHFGNGATYSLDALSGQVLDLQLTLKKLLALQTHQTRTGGRGQPITRKHEAAANDLIAAGMSRGQAAKQLGISRTAVSLLAAGKYPFGTTA